MNDRDQTIATIKAALQKRSHKQWSVTGGRGTAWGWITIDAPPSRRTWDHRLKADASPAEMPEDYEEYDTGKPGGHMAPGDRKELGELLGLDGPVHFQGQSIPPDQYRQFIACAEGRQCNQAKPEPAAPVNDSVLCHVCLTEYHQLDQPAEYQRILAHAHKIKGTSINVPYLIELLNQAQHALNQALLGNPPPVDVAIALYQNLGTAIAGLKKI